MVFRLESQWLPTVWTQLPFPRFLDDVTDGAERWSFAVVALERAGRVRLPPAARAAVGECASLRASTRGDVVVLRGGGAGRPVMIDGRGRLVVPCWLRDAAGPAASLLIGTRTEPDDEPIVLLAPPRLLAGFADALMGEWW